MTIRRAVLLIADIGGYTHYMHWNRSHLAHAQQTVAGLLESVIDAGKGLKLAKLEGDAAATLPGTCPRKSISKKPATLLVFKSASARMASRVFCAEKRNSLVLPATVLSKGKDPKLVATFPPEFVDR